MWFVIGFILGILATGASVWLYTVGFHYALAKGWIR